MSNDHKLTGTYARITEDLERDDARIKKATTARCDFCDAETPKSELRILSMEGHLRCKDCLKEPDPMGFKLPPFGKTIAK